MSETIAFYTPSPPKNRFVRCALALIASYCDVDFVWADPEDATPLLAYGALGCGASLHVPRREGPFDRDSIPSAPLTSTQFAEDVFPFDLFAALEFWLCDQGHRDVSKEDLDHHGRLKAVASHQHALGVRVRPIVNAYLADFARWLGQRVRVGTPRLLSPGKRAIVVLSHDVDDPIDPGDLYYRARLALHSASKGDGGHKLLTRGRDIIRALEYKARRPNARHWVFRGLMEEEARRGFASSYYFAPTSSIGSRGHRLDVSYYTGDRRFGPVYQMLKDNGSEVGLHIGYLAKDHPKQLAEEIDALERQIGRRVVGARHHYWRVGVPPWRMLERHAEVGLRYDSSVSFNLLPGYRFGVAYPLHLQSPDSGALIRTLQIPVMTMDQAMMLDEGRCRDLDEVRVLFQHLLDQLKANYGVAAIDWHVRTSFPGGSVFDAWGDGYLALLDILAADPEVEVLTGRAVQRRAASFDDPWKAGWVPRGVPPELMAS